MRSVWRRLRGRTKLDRVRVVPEHESPLRLFLAEAHGERYETVRSLAEARAVESMTVVMEGDYGGSIYLTCPARLVACPEDRLQQLLLDLDEHYWDDPEGAGLFYERAPTGSGISGGTGGGTVTEGVWLHPTLEEKGLRAGVDAVLSGEHERIG